MADATLKRIRKGTRSCTECRVRKTRCIFTKPSDNICQFCRERGRTCVPQTHTRRQRSDTTSRDVLSDDRLHRLERQIARISAKVGRHSAHGDQASDAETDSSVGDDADSADRNTDGPSGHDGQDVPAGDTPPTHLRVLFDNALISVSDQDNRGSLPTVSFNDSANGLRSSSSKHLAQARRRLQRLLPSKSDVRKVFSQTSMSAYTGLFPLLSIMREPEVMLENYDDYLKTTVDPILVAVFLLTVAMMTRQLPVSDLSVVLGSISNAPQFAGTVARTIRETVIAHNEVVPTLDGLETTIAYTRLQLARGEIRDVWFSIRKLVALAELIGLPRAASLNAQQQRIASAQPSTSSPFDPEQLRKVELFAAICAADRMSSMMFNLPATTGNFRIPARPIVNESDGSVNVHAYCFSLGATAARVQEIDEDFASGQPPAEIYTRVLTADRELRSLAATAPRGWWHSTSDGQTNSPDLTVLLVQLLHCYITVRVHLHFAMKDNHNEEDKADTYAPATDSYILPNTAPYAYSRSACIEACKIVARRYPALRALIPHGFFLKRLLHMQVFTIATVLLLARHQDLRNAAKSGGPRAGNPSETQEMLDLALQMLAVLEADSDQVGSESARDAAVALRALHVLLEDPTAAPAEGLALQIPMLGKVHIGRRAQRQGPVISQQGPATTAFYNHEQMRSGQIAEEHAMIPQFVPTVPVEQIQQDDLSWLLELDINSTMQNPFMAATGAELDGWMDWSSSGDGLYPDMPS